MASYLEIKRRRGNRSGLHLFGPVIAIWIIFTLGGNALAQMRGLTVEELAISSDLVVLGEVEEVKVSWSDDGRRIVSRASVVVREIVRGISKEKTVTVEYPGGEIDGIGMRVSDVAPLGKGERVLLFLSEGRDRKAGEVRELVGKAQGKYSVGEDGIATKKGFRVVERPQAVEDRLPMEEIIRRVKAVEGTNVKDK